VSELYAKQEDFDETRKMVRFILHRLDKLETRIRDLEAENFTDQDGKPRAIPERP
jgi:BMFP domain-containing protein YqiC